MLVALVFDKLPLVVMDSGRIRAASKWLRHFARECPGLTAVVMRLPLQLLASVHNCAELIPNEKGRQHVPAFISSNRSQPHHAWLAISLPSADWAAARRAIGTR
ncbi:MULTISPECIES: hypothetical protein [unclassified Bradyrhizobium]|uniref:hypothetical protein n=1 Tax=unclassified Bradyrhizobium TaxID=2631580 RepID=UPI0028E3EF6F|nr:MULTISPECIES: hypothetical protein [unclassified Bradyrhizobium]